MKKFLTVSLAAVAAAGIIAGCGSIQSTDKNNGTPVSDSQDFEKDKISETVLNIDIAASLKNSMTEIIEAYNKTKPQVKIIINADSSGTLQNQIEESAGTDVDLFFSASTKQMDKLKEEGYIKEESVKNLLKNKVVLIGTNDTKVTGFDDMTKAKSMALANESVPVGQYSREIFETLDITDKINSMEINQCDNVSAVKDAVKEGSNEIGTVYYSDYYSVKDNVKLIAEAEEGWCRPIVYPAGLVKNPNADENQQAAAEDFIKFLETDEAKEIFAKYMFVAE